MLTSCCNAEIFRNEMYYLHLGSYSLTMMFVLIIAFYVRNRLLVDIEKRNTPFIADKMTAKNSWGVFSFVSITLFTSTMIFLKLLEISFLRNILNVGNANLNVHTLSEYVIFYKYIALTNLA